MIAELTRRRRATATCLTTAEARPQAVFELTWVRLFSKHTRLS
jgi:hypothetical protein